MNTRQKAVSLSLLAALSALLASSGRASGTGIEQRFLNPPPEARPRVMYFIDNGAADKAGITADLEAMKANGIGGATFYIEHREAMKEERPLEYFSPEFRALLDHLLAEGKRLGLEFHFNNCVGSSTAGGPWNAPEDSMKKVVWTEATVEGGTSPVLPQPQTLRDFYRDIAVLAYPLPRPLPTPAFRANGLRLSAPQASGNAMEMIDGDRFSTALFREQEGGNPHEILFEYDTPLTLDRFFFYGNLFKYNVPLEAHLEAADAASDGGWKRVASIRQDGDRAVMTPFETIRAARFRVLISASEGRRSVNLWIAEIGLYGPGERPATYPQFNDFSQAVATGSGDIRPFEGILFDGDEPLDPERAIDLTAKLGADGRLDWVAPDGAWLVLRIGCTTTGKTNHPAKAAGEGLEVDKLDAAKVRRHFEESFRHLVGDSAPEALAGYHTDSWEASGQNWTDALPSLFEKRNGYDLRRHLPVLTGRLVGSPDQTRRFLFDFRRTLQALIAENFVGTMTAESRRRGFAYQMQTPAGHVPLVDPSLYLQEVDLPMGESWTAGNFRNGGTWNTGAYAVAAAASFTGRRIVPAEAFTSHTGNFQESPRWLQYQSNWYYLRGMNRHTLHVYVAQPSTDRPPGWTMQQFGTSFQRHTTWWKEARPWLDGLARRQAVLQAGTALRDVCVILPPERCLAERGDPRQMELAQPAEGFDALWTTDAGLARAGALADGKPRHALIVLPDHPECSLDLLRQLDAHVAAGGTVLGPRPQTRAGLAGGEAADREFAALADKLWKSGRVFTGLTPAQALEKIGIAPDFVADKAAGKGKIGFLHLRAEGGEDVYFLANSSDDPAQAVASFRIQGRAPQIWRPDAGAIERPALYRFDDGRVTLPLRFGPQESFFVVFGQPEKTPPVAALSRDGAVLFGPGTKGTPGGLPDIKIVEDGSFLVSAGAPGNYKLALPGGKTLAYTPQPLERLPLKGPWAVAFDGAAAPPPLGMEALAPLDKHPDAAVRHFSGHARYTTTFDLPAGFPGQGRSAWLDLGEIRELARVELNGHDLGVWWKPPFRAEITGHLKPGKNELEITAVNTWANRLIGDAALPPDKRATWISWKHFNPGDPLPPSGLIGPARIETQSALHLRDTGP